MIDVKVNWQIPVSHQNYNRMPASVWIRCLQMLPYLKGWGIRSTVNLPDEQPDVHVVIRQQDDAAYHLARQQKERGARIVFDLVVNYFDAAEVRGVGQTVTAQHIDQVHRMLSIADAVTCASQNIAERAKQYHPHVHYISDSIDRRHFRHRKPAGDYYRPQLRAIWSGAPNKVVELEPVLPLLRAHNVELTVITSGDHLRGYLASIVRSWRIPYRFVRWQYERFPQQILQGEFCIGYRAVDNPYNRGHSLFKVGVFMAQGVPALVSPVPSYQEVVFDRENGRILFENSIEEWGLALEEVVQKRDRLAAWSSKAIGAVEPYFSDRIAKEYYRLFQAICA